MLECYRVLAEEWLALPVLTGTKTDRERFAGAVTTYCIEALMRDGKALQAGTSHFLGQNFAKAFEIQFQNKDGVLEHAWQTSWGVSTRLVGALVLGHGDEKGLILPPKIAPVQVVIVPIYKTDAEKETVTAKCREIEQALNPVARVKVDDRDNYTPGFKFNYWEQKGVPLRLNIGPRDVASNVVEIARRDTGEKIRGVAEATLQTEIPKLLETIQKSIFERALKYRQENTSTVETYEQFKQAISEKGGFIEAFWAGSGDDEGRVKEETKATIRCIPFAQDGKEGKCMLTGKPTSTKAIFARAY
jgi:prolyl-tRNA synthetase